MATPSPTDQIAERVDRLLLRHAELQRTNALLTDQVAALTQERDSLKSRLSAARAADNALVLVSFASHTTAAWSQCPLGATPPTIRGCMAIPSPTDQIAERVERLLLRHAELQRTNALLADQVAALTQERDSLKSRLSAARARVDALLERLPAAAPLTKEAE